MACVEAYGDSATYWKAKSEAQEKDNQTRRQEENLMRGSKPAERRPAKPEAR